MPMPIFKEITQVARGEGGRNFEAIKKAGGFNNWPPYHAWPIETRRAYLKLMCLVDVGNLFDHPILGPDIIRGKSKDQRMLLPTQWTDWVDNYLKAKDKEAWLAKNKLPAAFTAPKDLVMYIQASSDPTRPTVSSTLGDGVKGSNTFLIDMQSEAAKKKKNATKLIFRDWAKAIPGIPKNAGVLKGPALYMDTDKLETANHIAIHLADNSVNELSFLTPIPIEWITANPEPKTTNVKF